MISRLALCLLLVLGMAAQAFGASSAVQSMKCSEDKTQCVLNVDWTAHTDGTFTSVVLDAGYMRSLQGFYLYEVEADPGSPAPLNNYDFTLTRTATGYSYDVLGGAGSNHDNSTTQAFYPKNVTGSRFVPVGSGDTYTLGISGIGAVSGARGVIRFWFVK